MSTIQRKKTERWQREHNWTLCLMLVCLVWTFPRASHQPHLISVYTFVGEINETIGPGGWVWTLHPKLVFVFGFWSQLNAWNRSCRDRMFFPSSQACKWIVFWSEWADFIKFCPIGSKFRSARSPWNPDTRVYLGFYKVHRVWIS